MWSLEKNVTKNAKDINLGIELLPLTLPSKSLNKVNSTVLILLFFKLFIFPFPFFEMGTDWHAWTLFPPLRVLKTNHMN